MPRQYSIAGQLCSKLFRAGCGRVGSQRVPSRHFSNCPPPNRTCQFLSIRLSDWFMQVFVSLPHLNTSELLAVASRIPHSSVFIVYQPVPLRPVTGVTVSLVGRNSHDYYWDSVTIGVSARRPSRFPYVTNAIDRRRNVTHALALLLADVRELFPF
jgi:hypothetical protein